MNDDPPPKPRSPQQAEDRRRQFEAMLREAQEEADRDGDFTLEEVLAEMDRIIDAEDR